MAELSDLLNQLETSKGQQLEPPWPRFTQLVRECLDQAAQAADATGRDRQELFEHVHAQERYAEQALDEHNQALYRECWDNLEKYSGYLRQLNSDALPRQSAPPPRSPEEEAREDLERFRRFLSAVWKQVRARQRADLESRLKELAGKAAGLSSRVKSEPRAVLREVHRLGTEVEKVVGRIQDGPRQSGAGDAGLLEGSV
jgi:hypothetical protein